MAGSHVIQRNTDVFQFTDKPGQNVRLANGKTSALWFQRCFDGKCFVTEPLSRGGRLTLELSGSGALLLGLLNRRPTKSEVRDVENKLSPNCVYLQEYDMHKQKKFTVSLSRETSREVKLKNDVETRTLEIKNGHIFLAFELLFGDFVMELLSDDGRNYKFDAVCGPNIRYPSRSCTSVCLQNAYGDTLCSASRAVEKRETIHLIFNPVDEAKWCHMITYLSNRSPAMMDANNMKMGLRSRMKFKLRGSVQLCFQDGGVPSYAFNGRKKRADVSDLDLSAPLFLYMQLFRVRVDLHTARPISFGPTRCVIDGADNRSGDGPLPRELPRSVIDGADNRSGDGPLPRELPRSDIDGADNRSGDGPLPRELPRSVIDGADNRSGDGPLPRELPRSVIDGADNRSGDGPLPRELPRSVIDGADNRSGDGPLPRELPRSVIDGAHARPAAGAGSSECLMTKKSFSNLIQSNYVYLQEILDPGPLADHLLAGHKMSPTQAEEILELPTRRKKCEKVLHILMKVPDTEETFVRAMGYPQHPQKHILFKLGLLEGASSRDCET
ncbi:uncharacterized protein LOC124113592 [Haliotis rufescens]|uniref:uncharacterized protein LOC124113592 n=1 Tax=Haliotis rufescens TaxID=6454 RepID=UPI00201F14DE|nr:uncharacterized protein LOC124113592 [Haliotis rufescens]